MKTLIGVISLTLALLFGAFSAWPRPKAAAPAAEKKPASLQLMMTGKEAGGWEQKTFTIMAKGKQHTFIANNFAMPKSERLLM